MTKDDFIRLCTSGGYAYKKLAKEYAENHEELTDDDLEEVYRMSCKRERVGESGKWRVYQGVKCTKRLDREEIE